MENTAVYLTMTPLERLILAEWEELAAANPYGCNGAGHKPGCPKGDTQRLTAPEKWKPASLPRLVGAAQGLRVLKKGVSALDPTGHEVQVRYSVFLHWVRSGKKLSDIRRRLKNLNRALMAIRQPNEIWLNKEGSRIYLSAQQFEKRGKMQGARNYYVSMTIKGNSVELATYYGDEDVRKIKNKREGVCIYKKSSRE